MNEQTEVIIPAVSGLRCVVWPLNEPYWTAGSRGKDSSADAVNQNCWSVIGWSIAGDKPPVPILSNGKFNSLRDSASGNCIALLHADGAVEWQGQFFTGVEDFVRAARTYELSLGK